MKRTTDSYNVNTRNIGDEVYVLDALKKIHKTSVTQIKAMFLVGEKGHVTQVWYTVQGQNSDRWFYEKEVFDSPEDALKSILTEVIDDTK